MSTLGETVTRDLYVVEQRGTRSHLPPDHPARTFWTEVGSSGLRETAERIAHEHAARYPSAVLRIVHEVTTVTRTEVDQ